LNMLGPELELNISVPEQTLGDLTFAEATPQAIAEWVHGLPMANLGESSRQLYQAISELNKLVCSPNDRSQVLETLRTPIHYVCEELSKHFLNASVAPHEKQRKIVNLVQTLQMQLATGYKIVLVDSMPNLGSENVRKNFSCAAHRFISELGRVLLVCSQLYLGAPKNIWKEMNEVFRFCDSLALMKYIVHDTENTHAPDTSILRAYKRNLLLSCCRPNQLRQKDIQTVYEAFEVWSDYVELGPKYISSAVFCINLADDYSPRYKTLIHKELDEYYFGFDTAELVTRITSYLTAGQQAKEDEVKHLEMPVKMSNGLLAQLNHSLGILTKRTFKRIASNGRLDIGVGLSSCHFHASGKTVFHSHLFGRTESDFDQGERNNMRGAYEQHDPWSNAFDADDMHTAKSLRTTSVIDYSGGSKSNTDKDFPIYDASLVNTSPGGYCVDWEGDVPKAVQAGELLCVRESNSANWSVAVIRWIRHSKQKGTQLGIELLAPRARPCAVQQLHKTGKHSEFLRGLLLPELSSIGQPSTLITPRVPFQQGNKVALRFNGQEIKCILSSSVAETGSFSQFVMSESVSLDSKSPTLKPTAENQFSSEDDFDSLWPSL
jgi:cyclic-di-GMP-binding protein